MALSPNFAATPRAGTCHLSVGNPSLGGAGTTEAAFTAGAAGSRVDVACVKATGSTTAGMVRFFLHNGVSAFFLTEVAVLATAASASARSFETLVEFKGGVTLQPGHSLRCSTEKSEGFDVVIFGGDF